MNTDESFDQFLAIIRKEIVKSFPGKKVFYVHLFMDSKISFKMKCLSSISASESLGKLIFGFTGYFLLPKS